MDVYRKKEPKTYETMGPHAEMVYSGYVNYLIDELERMMWAQKHIYNRKELELQFNLIETVYKICTPLDIDYIDRCKKAYEEKIEWKA